MVITQIKNLDSTSRWWKIDLGHADGELTEQIRSAGGYKFGIRLKDDVVEWLIENEIVFKKTSFDHRVLLTLYHDIDAFNFKLRYGWSKNIAPRADLRLNDQTLGIRIFQRCVTFLPTL